MSDQHNRDGHHHHEGHHEGHHHGGPSHGGNHGPANTSFLHLEISKMLYGEAQELTRQAAQELIKDAIKNRLRERVGPMLERIGQLAADEALDDFETNRKIEVLIQARQQTSQSLAERLEQALRGDEPK